MKNTYVKASAALFLFASAIAAPNARAQEWLKDRKYSEGAGWRAGNFELHPGIAVEGGYDSNWFFRTNKTGTGIVNGNVLPAGLLRVTPSFALSTLGPQRRTGTEGEVDLPSVNFRAGASATYREFFGAQEIRDQRNVGGNVNMKLEFAPGRPVGGELGAIYNRVVRPSSSGDPNLAFNRNEITGSGAVVFAPGGGLLDWRVGYQARAELFDDTAQYNSLTHEAFTKGRWRFRPRTAFIYDATGRFTTYLSPILLRNSTPFRTRLGMTGLITPRFALTAMAGWGSSFIDTGGNAAVPQYDSVIAEAELRWFLSGSPASQENASEASLAVSYLALGYNRDFQPSLISNFVGIDRGFAKFVFFFGGKALISAEVGVGTAKYPDILGSSGGVIKPSFTDIRADATLYSEYRFSDSFAINATGKFTGNFSKNQIPADLTGTISNTLVDMNWRRIEAFLGVRWFL